MTHRFCSFNLNDHPKSNNFMKPFILQLLLLSIAFSMSAQNIRFPNPSFEGIPQVGRLGAIGAEGWFDCGFEGETAADIQPSRSYQEAFFGVTTEAFHGRTYLGMVTRDTDTWEAVGTDLDVSMKKGASYRFSVHLSRSKKYTSVSRKSNQEASFTTPIVFRVWGGHDPCERQQLFTSKKYLSISRRTEMPVEYTTQQY